MISIQTQAVSDRARAIYAGRLKESLEADHRDRFVAIEPDSEDYFVGDSLANFPFPTPRRYDYDPRTSAGAVTWKTMCSESN